MPSARAASVFTRALSTKIAFSGSHAEGIEYRREGFGLRFRHLDLAGEHDQVHANLKAELGDGPGPGTGGCIGEGRRPVAASQAPGVLDQFFLESLTGEAVGPEVGQLFERHAKDLCGGHPRL